MTPISKALGCACYAMAGTVFYKKNFNKSGIPTVAMCLLFGFSLEFVDDIPYLGYLASFFAAIFVLTDDHWFRSAFKLDLFLTLLFAVFDVKYGVQSFVPAVGRAKQNDHQNITTKTITVDIGLLTNQTRPRTTTIDVSTKDLVAVDVLFGCWNDVIMMTYQETMIFIGHIFLAILWYLPTWRGIRIVLVAIPQFLRRPTWLKAKLQGIRSKLGPLYVMYLVSYMFRCDLPQNSFMMWGRYVTAIASVVAGVFLRPDNSAMLDLVGISWKHAHRRYYHGRLMAATFFIVCICLFINY